MLGEFTSVLIDRLKTYEPFLTNVKDYYYGDMPLPANRKYPCVLVRERPGRSSDEDHFTTNAPEIHARYQVQILDRTTETKIDTGAVQEMERRVTHWADVAKEVLKTDATIRGLTLDFKCVGTDYTPAPESDYSEASVTIEFEAVFNTNAGVIGYSVIGEFIIG